MRGEIGFGTVLAQNFGSSVSLQLAAGEAQIRRLVIATLIEAQLHAVGYEGAARHRAVVGDAPWYELPLIVGFRPRLLSFTGR